MEMMAGPITVTTSMATSSRGLTVVEGMVGNTRISSCIAGVRIYNTNENIVDLETRIAGFFPNRWVYTGEEISLRNILTS